MAGLSIATFNVRNTDDRWDARLPLVVLGHGVPAAGCHRAPGGVYPLQQDRIVGAAGAAHYRTIRGWA